MGIQVIHSTVHTARKDYHDDGWDYVWGWIDGGCYLGTYLKPRKVCFADARILVKYRKDRSLGWKISKGDKYVRQFNGDGGDTWTFRMKKELYDIACKYDLFSDD